MLNAYLFPSTVLVEPTNKCNLFCTFCEANCTVNRNVIPHNLTPTELQIILYKIEKYIINIVFQGDCEPTLNRYLPDLVKIASKYTSSVALVTNGTYLSQEYVKRLIDSGLTWFAISIDDHRPEIYGKLRNRASLSNLLYNLKQLIYIRDIEFPNLHVAIHKIVFPNDTIDSLKEFVKTFYLYYRVNQITFAPLVDQGIIKVSNWLLKRNQVESELMAEGIHINLRDFGSYPYKTLHKYCGTNLLFIDHQGNLSPCGLHVRQGKKFGNLLRSSLEEIANNFDFRDFHAYWSRKEYCRHLPAQCSNCFVLKTDYYRYTLNEGHDIGLQFSARMNF